jgi:hypothetical protein
MTIGNHPNLIFVRMSRLLKLLALAAVGLLAARAEAAPGVAPLRVGVVLDAPGHRTNELLSHVERELEALSSPGRRPVTLVPERPVAGQGTLSSVQAAVAALLDDPEVDALMGFGLLASEALARLETLDKPALSPFLVRVGGAAAGPAPASPHLDVVEWATTFERDLGALSQLGPYRRVAWLGWSELHASLPGLSGALEVAAHAAGLELSVVLVGDDVPGALSQIPAEVDAVYLGPNPQLDDSRLSALAEGLVERRLASFSWLGEPHVERGILAGLGSNT